MALTDMQSKIDEVWSYVGVHLEFFDPRMISTSFELLLDSLETHPKGPCVTNADISTLPSALKKSEDLGCERWRVLIVGRSRGGSFHQRKHCFRMKRNRQTLIS